MMTGLTPPSSGRSTILGVPFAQLRNPGRHVGVLLDASAQHNGRTGREVLRLGATVMGLPRRRVDEMLETVGLSGTEATAGSATTPSACGSDSVSRTHCSVTRRC